MISVQNNLRQLFTLLVTLFVIFSVFIFQPSSFAQSVDDSLEKQVLLIIREHPEAIKEALQMQKQKEYQKYQKKLKEFAEEAKNHPSEVIGTSPTTGSIEGKILLIEFSDFQCPYCAQASSVLKQFLSKHQQEVTLIYKHFPITSIHSEAMPAAKAAWAAEQQGKFWEYHEALFKQQKRLNEGLYRNIAKSLGLNIEKFDKDRLGEAANSAIQQDIDMVNQLGINSTPFFIMGSENFAGVLSLDDMEQLLSKLVPKA
ncbi:thioredoxin domain-containing protein [Nostoc sp. NIES-2111]